MLGTGHCGNCGWIFKDICPHCGNSTVSALDIKDEQRKRGGRVEQNLGRCSRHGYHGKEYCPYCGER